jgi:outer membrane lipoprotein-sorting protein
MAEVIWHKLVSSDLQGPEYIAAPLSRHDRSNHCAVHDVRRQISAKTAINRHKELTSAMVRYAQLLSLCAAVLIASTAVCGGQATPSAPAQGPICPSPGDLSPRSGEHPLAPLIRWGKAGVAALQRVDAYTCRLAKRERVGGKLSNYQWMSVKVRQNPFSVYAAFANKQERPWQEVVYVEHRDGGKMFVHSDEFRLMGTVSLFPDSDRAMRDNRYPLTEVGVLNLIQRLVEHAENDSKFEDCEVKIFKDAKIESRPCLYIRVTHKARRPEFSFHMARIFIDNELNVPVRYEAYTWPDEPNGKPLLMEEYTYLDFKLNSQFTDRDFDIHNPDYFFPPDFGEPDVDFADVKPVAQLPGTSGKDGSKSGDSAQPLAGVLALAKVTMARVNQARDYTCLLSHREQSGAEPGKYENLLLKIRHDPLAVYAFFLGPKTPKGQEAIYKSGPTGQNVVVHSVPGQGRPTVTRQVAADSAELTTSTGEPMNNLGMRSQLARWIAMYEAELPHGEATVKYYPEVELDQHLATCIEVTHPTARPHFRFERTRWYIDDELKLPVRFEAYGWPASPGGKPPLVEEVNFRNVEINRGYTDEDFDPSNPNYAFGRQGPTVRTTSR